MRKMRVDWVRGGQKEMGGNFRKLECIYSIAEESNHTLVHRPAATFVRCLVLGK